MKVIRSFKGEKNAVSTGLYFVQFGMSWLSSRNNGRVIRDMQIVHNLVEAISGHHLTKGRNIGKLPLLPVHFSLEHLTTPIAMFSPKEYFSSS